MQAVELQFPMANSSAVSTTMHMEKSTKPWVTSHIQRRLAWVGLKADAPYVGRIDELFRGKMAEWTLPAQNVELLPNGRPQNKQPCGGVLQQDKQSCWEGSS